MNRFVIASVVALVFVSNSAAAQGEIFSDDFEWGSICAWSNDYWSVDRDEDLFGDETDAGVLSNCPPPVGTTSNNLDCDDDDPDVYPGRPEFCDGIDNDCSGEADDVCLCWSSNCDVVADCVDSNSGPQCVCPPGFEGDGLTCTDIDECITDPCDQNATCSNEPGYFSCTCIPGYAGDGSTCTAIPDCAAVLAADPSAPSGVYTIDSDGPDNEPPYDVHCDMNTDGGGWTLLGVISGADQNNWNSQYGYWSDANTLGDPNFINADYKSRAWTSLDISNSEIMLERQYDGNVEAQSVLGNACLNGQSIFTGLFVTTDTSLACTPDDIDTLFGSAIGVASADYAEGAGVSGLGGVGTNGFCWNGGDNYANIFDGHLVWNQYLGGGCLQSGHLGGIGVYQNASTQYTNADITGTSWLLGTDYTLTVIRVYARALPSGSPAR